MSENDCKYVSSRGILKSCDIYSSTPISGITHLINYDFSQIKENSIIYICVSAIPYFINNIFYKLPYNIILVTGDNDETVPSDFFNKETGDFLRFIECDKLIHWYSQNCILTTHPKITQMPIGLDYHTMSTQDHLWGKQLSPLDQESMLEHIKLNSKPFYEREKKAYSNFHFFMGTKFGYDRINAKEQIPEELVFYEPIRVERELSWKTQTQYAFVISPHGNGLDCHRTWEALCLGCIVIVKTSALDPLYEELPVLIVKEWSNINQELLDNTIIEFKNKNFNNNKLNLKYWVNKIKSYRDAINIMKSKSVVITGCCRNNDIYIKQNLNIIDKIGQQFKEYKVIIYENDSNDNTRQTLIENKKYNYDYIFEDNINISNRTERIAYCRNKILQQVNISNYTNYDYLLMLDLDDVLVSGKIISTIKSCFLYNSTQWDAMFANCSDEYYDIYALRKKKYLTTCCWNNVYLSKQLGISHEIAYERCINKYIINYPIYTKIMPVISAFGGAGLYKLSCILKTNATYNGYEPTHVDKQICEHVSFNTTLVKNSYKLYINPRMLIR